MDKLNILMIGSEFDTVPPTCGGGIERVIDRLTHYLAKKGHNVYLITLRNSHSLGNIQRNICRMEIDRDKSHPSFYKILRFNASLLNKKNMEVDVVHTHTRYSALVANNLFSKPIIFSVHNAEAWISAPPTIKERLKYHFVRQIEINAIEKSTSCLVVSQSLMATITRNIRRKLDNLVYFPNAVDLSLFNSSEKKEILSKYKFNESKLIILQVGRIHPRKGIHTLLQAAASLKEVATEIQFIVIGPYYSYTGSNVSFDYLEDLREIMRTERIRNVRFLGGQLPYSDILKLYASSDIYVSTSYAEGMPLSILEAMASGKPIVATNVGGNSELVSNNVNGLLFKPGDHLELSNLILRLYDDADLRKKMGQRSRNIIENCYTWEQRTESLISIYKKAIESQ